MEALRITLSIMCGVVAIGLLAGAFVAGATALEECDPAEAAAAVIVFLLFGACLWGSFVLYPDPA